MRRQMTCNNYKIVYHLNSLLSSFHRHYCIALLHHLCWISIWILSGSLMHLLLLISSTLTLRNAIATCHNTNTTRASSCSILITTASHVRQVHETSWSELLTCAVVPTTADAWHSQLLEQFQWFFLVSSEFLQRPTVISLILLVLANAFRQSQQITEPHA